MSGWREPKALGDELRRLGDKLGGRGQGSGLRISSAWSAIVGPEIARHTTVLGVRDNEMLVGVDSPAWAAELSMMAEELRERLELEDGGTPLKGIRFTVTREVERVRAREAAEEAAGTRYGGPRVEPASLTDEEIAAIRATVAPIENAELRAAAFRAITKDLQWKKGIREPNGPQGESEGL